MRATIVSVNYGDLLAVTLPAWKALLPKGCLNVATSLHDVESQAIAEQHGVPYCATDAWTRADRGMHRGGPPTFNAAFGMDVALGLAEEARARPDIGEVIININADCYPAGGTFPSESTIGRGVLYGFWRWHCLTPDLFEDFKAGRANQESFGRRMKNSGGRPVGYFQMWRYRKDARFGSYPTAGKYDTHFCSQWDRLEMRDDVWLLHLGPQEDHENWAGRVVPRWGAA